MTHTSRVMVVDDEPVARETIEMVLSVEGYDLVVASNGPEALVLAAAEPPDLILLDVMMPEMDGFEVCRRLRRSRTGPGPRHHRHGAGGPGLAPPGH